MDRRLLKVEKTIHQLIANYLVTHFQGELLGFISVSKVSLSKDFKNGKVFVRSYGEDANKDHNLDFLNQRVYPVQKHIHKNLRLKFYPKLVFLEDESVEKHFRVQKLISDINKTK